MAAIKPFRHLIEYPPMIRQIGRNRERRRPRPSTGTLQSAFPADCTR
jgi:hypothetical protein